MPGADPGWWGHHGADSPLSPWRGGTAGAQSTPVPAQAAPPLCTQTVCQSVVPPERRLRPDRAHWPHPGPAPSSPAPQQALLASG